MLKRKKGVIFSNPSLYKKFVFYGGNGFVVASIGFFVYLYWPLANSYLKYKNNMQTFKSGSSEKVAFQQMVQNPEKEESNVFTIQIPKILADSKIVANISPFDSQEYLDVLKENVVAHSSLSSLPGKGKGSSTYIFAHSSDQGLGMARKNVVFYLLGELKNDDLIFVNHRGKIYTYKVYMQKIIRPNETEYLEYKDQDKEVLILQTCWPIGTDWKRLLVFAERIRY